MKSLKNIKIIEIENLDDEVYYDNINNISNIL